MKKRLDSILVEKGYFSSKSKAHSAILAGHVFINQKKEDKSGRNFAEEKIQLIEIKQPDKYVSRGGYKLEKALNDFKIRIKGMTCMDVGCSTGGFTDCLLQNKAEKVYAIDVGYGQFDYNLRQDKRVVLYEKQNIRYLDKSSIKDKIDIMVIDVSFISITKFLHNLIDLCADNFNIIILIKPQFESEKGEVQKGVIRSVKQHEKIIFKLMDYFKEHHLFVSNFTYSPVRGPKGNIEFLVHLASKGAAINRDKIRQQIKESSGI